MYWNTIVYKGYEKRPKEGEWYYYYGIYFHVNKLLFFYYNKSNSCDLLISGVSLLIHPRAAPTNNHTK